MRRLYTLIAVLLSCVCANAQVLEADSLALVNLFQSSSGDWNNAENWLVEGQEVSTWQGITVENNRVTEIDISDNGLNSLHDAFNDGEGLDSLHVLDISNNVIFSPSPPVGLIFLTDFRVLRMGGTAYQSIPPFQALPDNNNLIELDVSNNTLFNLSSGAVFNLNKLQIFRASNCQNDGNLPVEFGSLSNLRVLDLSNNAYTGAIPAEFANLNQIEELNLSDNELEGTLPSGFEDITTFTSIQLGGNSFSGELFDLNNSPNLVYVNLDANNFEGALTIGSELNNLEYLNVSSNEFTSIAEGLDALSSIKRLVLYNNDFTGAIPADLSNLSDLTYLDLSWNEFTDIEAGALEGLTNVDTLLLRSNFELSADIPAAIGTMTQLKHLEARDCQLSGEIPGDFNNLTQLEYLNLSGNELTGISSDLGSNWTQLRTLDLSMNELSGDAPDGFADMSALESIYINDNQLTSFPDIGDIPVLDEVKMENNKFTFGDICPQVGGFVTTTYAPQDSVLETEQHIVLLGGTLTISSDLFDGGAANCDLFNMYEWSKDGQVVQSGTNPDFEITDADLDDEGIYTCSVTNGFAPALTLERRPIEVIVDVVSGLQSEHAKGLISASPNPFTDLIFLDIHLSGSKSGRVVLRNTMGAEVRDFQVLPTENHRRIQIQTDDLPTGCYFVEIQTNKSSEVIKLLKSK